MLVRDPFARLAVGAMADNQVLIGCLLGCLRKPLSNPVWKFHIGREDIFIGKKKVPSVFILGVDIVLAVSTSELSVLLLCELLAALKSHTPKIAGYN